MSNILIKNTLKKMTSTRLYIFKKNCLHGTYDFIGVLTLNVLCSLHNFFLFVVNMTEYGDLK